MSLEDENRALIQAFWADLARRDFEKVGSYFAEEGRYEDIPTPDAGAVGPAQIASRLRVGLGPIEDYVHHTHLIVIEGNNIVTEHTEDWHFGDGVVVSLPFVSIHRVQDGKFISWKDYWDLQTLMGGAPAWWLEHIMKQAAEEGIS